MHSGSEGGDGMCVWVQKDIFNLVSWFTFRVAVLGFTMLIVPIECDTSGWCSRVISWLPRNVYPNRSRLTPPQEYERTVPLEV